MEPAMFVPQWQTKTPILAFWGAAGDAGEAWGAGDAWVVSFF